MKITQIWLCTEISFFERKILLLGKSHFLNYRPKYKSLKNISDLDYKIFSQNGEDGISGNRDFHAVSLEMESDLFALSPVEHRAMFKLNH